MEGKIEETLSRQGLAEYLEGLARGLRQGQLEVEGNTWSVPEKMEAKLSLKEKKGRLSFKLRFRWETLPEYKPKAREPVRRWQESFKTLKKRLAAHFKELQQAVLQGKFPGPQVLENFVADSKTMAQMAELDWQQPLKAYLDHLAALERAVAAQDLEATRHEVLDLRVAMENCHREFA
jgi:XXXCH domain-containing protein